MSAASALPLKARGNAETHRASDLLRVTVFLGAFALLFSEPLAFGGVEPWAIFTLEAASAVLFGLWAIAQTLGGELSITWNPIFIPALLFAGLLLIQVAFRQTAYRAATVSASLLFCSYGLLTFLLVQSLRRTGHLRAASMAFCFYGVVIALFGIVQSLTNNANIYWLTSPASGGWIYGPYVNHNHYAGLMEMLFPIPLVLCLSRRLNRDQRLLAGLASALMASTIFLCGSRAGMLAFVVQVVALFFLLVKRSSKKALLPLTFLVIVSALFVWLGGAQVFARISTIPSELSGGTRLTIERDCLRMFLAKPALGWGLGTFRELYPRFRSFYTNLSVDQAHNDYLQLLVETGACGFALLVWSLVIVLRASVRKLQSWPADINADLALAALLGILGIMVHSFFDFNLQIPANAAMFGALCAIAAMQPGIGIRHSHLHRAHNHAA
jgi:O-antigen ligase